MQSNLLILPYMSRYNDTKKVDEETTKQQIEEIATHYFRELVHKVHAHGFPITDSFGYDIDLSYEAFKSTLMRSLGKHHPLQDYVDEMREEYDEEISEEVSDDEDKEQG